MSKKTVYTLLFALLLVSTHPNSKGWGQKKDSGNLLHDKQKNFNNLFPPWT